jgi:hypothetical protein
VGVLDLSSTALISLGLLLGILSMCFACAEHHTRRGCWGRRLAVAALLCFGCSGFLAAGSRSSGFVPGGMLASLMVVGMFWESPKGGAKVHVSRTMDSQVRN